MKKTAKQTKLHESSITFYLPEGLKKSFVDKCIKEADSVSAVLRSLIKQFIKE